MALLQIAEPGQTAAPHQHRLAVGIDLGTTNSLVASVRSGQTQVLLDDQERALVPSVVHYGRTTKKRLGLSICTGESRSAKYGHFGETLNRSLACRRTNTLSGFALSIYCQR
ncbi:chaperone protein HscA [Actinobacillus pleuropneumoniae]|nr:chaperone protein HscA [Actinobacillus pleuropneumoniae]